MASSLLDELPCLLDESDELTARLGFYLKLLFSPPPTNRAHPSDPTHDSYVLRQQLGGVNIDAVARSFGKHILLAPSVNSSLSEKLDAMLPSTDSTSYQALQTLCAKIFHLMKRVYQWQQTMWDETLLPFFAANSSHLTFDRHRLLTSLVLTGVTKSVKLHLLWSSYPHLAGILVLHSYLDSKRTNVANGINAPLESYRPLDFVLYFGSNPLIKMQQELQQHALAHHVARNMLELVLSCFDCYVGCHDLAHLKNGGHVFEVDAATIQGSYASSPLLQDLLILPQLVEWVLCVALCLPHQWKSEPIRNSSWQLWDFVQLIVQDRLVLVVARDLCVNIHDLLFQQLTSALSGSTSTAHGLAPSLLPLKKTLTRLSKQTVQCGGDKRRERRVLVVWFLRDCVQLLRHNGGLAAPMLPRLLAVMALAQDELEWMLAHHCATKLAPNHVKTKHMDRAAKSFAINPVNLTELLALYQELRAVLAVERDYVGRYYTQFISRGDADAIARENQQFLAQSGEGAEPQDAHVLTMLQSFTDKRRFQLAVTDAGFASWRREWQQLSVHLLVDADASPIPASITSLLNRACRHANYVQHYDRLRLHVSSLSKCFWFQDALAECSREITKTDRTEADAVILTAVLNDLATGRAQVNELLEASEAAHEITRLCQRVEIQKRAVGDHLQRAIDTFLMQEEILHARLSPLQMIERMGRRSFQHGVSSSYKTAENAATAMMLLTPGMESRLLTTPDAAVSTALPLAAVRSHLSAIISNLDRHVLGPISGGSDPLGLRGVVASTVQACVVTFLRGLVQERDGKLLLRTAWEDAARQWCALRRCLNHQFQSSKWVHIPELIQSTLVDECQVSAHGADRVRCIDRVLAFYSALLHTKCVATARTVTHATLLASFAPTPNYVVHDSHRSVEMNPVKYASSSAFQYLEEITGREAMQAVRKVVVAYVATHVKMLYESLEKDKIALIRLKLAFPEDPNETLMAVRIMEALDSGIIHELLCVGNGVFLLEILDARSTHPEEVSQAEADLHGTLRSLWTPCSRNQDPEMEMLPSHVQTIWNLLPWAFAAAFYGALWAKTAYVHATDATTTNVHLLAPAMALLVETFEPRPSHLSPKESGAATGDRDLQRRACVRHMACIASQAVLSLRRVAPEMPTPAMVAVVALLTRRLAAAFPDGEVQDWLPDCIQKMMLVRAA
jgi:hypothetical protein